MTDTNEVDQRSGAEAGPGDGGASDRVVRITARLCYLIRDANRLSWFAPEVREQVDELHRDIEGCLEDAPMRFRFEPEMVILGDAHFEEPPKAVRQLIQMVRRKGFRAIEFKPGFSSFELVVLSQLLQSRGARPEPRDLEQLELIHLIEQDEPDRIQLGVGIRPSRLSKSVNEHDGADNEVRRLVTDITGAIDNIAVDPDSNSAAAPAIGEGDSGLLELVDQLGSNAEIALILSSLRRHDEYTYDHSINVGLLSICLARHIGWRGRDLHEFGVAALIHDVGKLYTPLEILNKPGRLTPQEWIKMKKHPKDGFEILREGGVGSDMAPYIAIEHHTAPTGEGYPALGYGVERMHPGSHIVKIADVYDAFTTIRPYRSQSRPKEVLKMLRKQAGTQFVGEFVEAFCEMMGEYPIGSTLKLRSGRIGLVVDVHAEEPTRPLVRVLQDDKGRKVRKLELVDLRTRDPETGMVLDEVEETIDPVIRNIPVGRYI